MKRKNLMGAMVLLVLIAVTVFVMFKDNDMGEVVKALKNLNLLFLAAAAATALLFTSVEGFIIWYLMKNLEGRVSLISCLRYSFVGFFFSGITPSSTGGQPMQLFYMRREGHRTSDSTVVLMAVALIYKFVLVMIGIGMLVLYYEPMKYYLQDYIYLYYLGLFLNGMLVVALLFIMVSPGCFKRIVLAGEKLLKKLHLLKDSGARTQKLIAMAERYHEAVVFFIKNKKKLLWVTFVAFLQRCSVFFMTWLVYKGMGMSGESMISVMVLQAAVYIAVDMLPLPGAQGITELMYKEGCICKSISGSLFDCIYVHNERIEFLFSADRQCRNCTLVSFWKKSENCISKKNKKRKSWNKSGSFVLTMLFLLYLNVSKKYIHTFSLFHCLL